MPDKKNTFWLWVSFSFAVNLIVIFLRKPDAFLNPQFWAEDGTVFFVQAYHNGILSIFEPYAGYYHLYPRLIAFLADFLKIPLQFLPAFYNYGWLLAFTIIFLYIWLRLGASVYEKFLLCAVLTVIPIDNEIFMHLTSSQWFLAPVLVLMAGAQYPESRGKRIFDYGLAVLIGLSGPFCLLFLPFFLFNAFKAKDKYSCNLFFILCAAGLIQLMALNTSPRVSIEGVFQLFNPDFINVAYKQYSYLFFGWSMAHAPYVFRLFFLACVAVVMVFWGAGFYKRKEKLGLFVLISGLMVLASALYIFKNQPGLLYPPGNGNRYFYIPSVMFLWSFIMFAHPAQPGLFKKYLLVCLFFFWVYNINFRQIPQFTDYRWPQWALQIPQKEMIDIPINPTGWERVHIDHQKRK